MVVTKTANRAFTLESNRRKANTGCNICPCCGENKSENFYNKSGVFDKGVFTNELISRTWTKGIFKVKHMKCDIYRCLTCGAEWESDPYEWR